MDFFWVNFCDCLNYENMNQIDCVRDNLSFGQSMVSILFFGDRKNSLLQERTTNGSWMPAFPLAKAPLNWGRSFQTQYLSGMFYITFYTLPIHFVYFFELFEPEKMFEKFQVQILTFWLQDLISRPPTWQKIFVPPVSLPVEIRLSIGPPTIISNLYL